MGSELVDFWLWTEKFCFQIDHCELYGAYFFLFLRSLLAGLLSSLGW